MNDCKCKMTVFNAPERKYTKPNAKFTTKAGRGMLDLGQKSLLSLFDWIMKNGLNKPFYLVKLQNL